MPSADVVFADEHRAGIFPGRFNPAMHASRDGGLRVFSFQKSLTILFIVTYLEASHTIRLLCNINTN